MSLRKTFWLLVLPVLALTAAVISWSWLFHTESGARWLFAKLDSAIPGSVEAASVSGDLASGLILERLEFNDGANLIDMDRLTLEVNLDLLPPSISFETVQIESLAIQVLREASEPVNWEAVLPGLIPPIPLHFENVGIAGLQYIDVSGEPVLVVDSIETGGSLFRELVLDRGSVTFPSKQLALSGRLNLIHPHPLTLDLSSSGETNIHCTMSGSLESAGIRLASESPRLQADGKLEHLLSSPQWDLEISSPLIQWPPGDDDPVVWLTSVEAQTTGRWSDYHLTLKGILGLEDLEPSRLELTGNGNEGSFTAREASLAGSSLALEAAAALSWQDQLHLELDTTLKHLDPAAWLEDWPENQFIEGKIVVEWGGQALNVSGFSLNLRDSDFAAEGHGIVDLQSGIVEAEMAWHDLSWPLDLETPVIKSDSGALSIAGQPDSWKIEGKLDVQAGELPRGQLQMSGSGNMESLELTIHEGSVLGGKFSGDLSWNWTGTQAFTATLTAGDINIGPLAPQYPGVLNAELSARGELEPFQLGVRVRSLDGKIKARPITANGGIYIEQNQLRADGLNIQWGASSLELDGDPWQRNGIAFTADIESLATFVDGISGSLSGQGILSLYSGSPLFSVRLSGERLAFGEVEIERLELQDRSEQGVGTGGDLLLTGVKIGERPIDSVSARFSGRVPLERIDVNALANDMSIELGLQGTVRDWGDPLGSGWSGLLSEFRLVQQQQFTLTLDQAAALKFNQNHFALETACFSGSRNTGMCLDSSWRSSGSADLSASLTAVPVGLLELAIDTDLEFTQILNGTLNWSRTPGSKLNGDARIEITPGAIRMTGDDEVLLNTGAGLFGFELTEGRLQRGDLDITIKNSGGIDMDFSVPDLSKGLDSSIQGRARIDLDNISQLVNIFPAFDTIRGALDVDVVMSGTLSDPAFNGRAGLVDGYLEHRASGFLFSEINLSGDVSELDQSELRGSFRAGEGTGEISANIEFEDILSPAVNVAVKGHSLTVIEVPDLKVIADPDIAVNWRNNLLEINGRLVIPTARISPSYVPQSSARQSNDVVIVAGELPEGETDFLRDSTFRVRGNLQLELGKQVVIDLDLAQASVSGITQFNWRDELIPVANGHFDVTGEIQAYGQLLRVTRGRIGFPGIPADNPHLNIRAEREIFGNSQIRRAGLMVAGTLRRPVVEAYTVPMTNKHRAQTLLVTGSDFDFEKGVGAVDVGTYIMPRLYVSYGIGVFEEGNVISARFDLGRGFGIKATSGERETGWDINYRIER
jgi:translocation and assembly module TamB